MKIKLFSALVPACLLLASTAVAAVTPVPPPDPYSEFPRFENVCEFEIDGLALQGDDANDTINGSATSDLLLGGGGKDSIFGLERDDCIFGESGGDKLRGHAGDDRIRGNSGRDLIRGGSGNDLINTGGGKDSVKAGAGIDGIVAHEGGKDDDRLRPRDRRGHPRSQGQGRRQLREALRRPRQQPHHQLPRGAPGLTARRVPRQGPPEAGPVSSLGRGLAGWPADDPGTAGGPGASALEWAGGPGSAPEPTPPACACGGGPVTPACAGTTAGAEPGALVAHRHSSASVAHSGFPASGCHRHWNAREDCRPRWNARAGHHPHRSARAGRQARLSGRVPLRSCAIGCSSVRSHVRRDRLESPLIRAPATHLRSRVAAVPASPSNGRPVFVDAGADSADALDLSSEPSGVSIKPA